MAELEFQGVNAFDTSRLTAVMVTRETGWLPWSDPECADREQLEADVRRLQAFYDDHGYPDAVVWFDVRPRTGRRADVVIFVSEGEPVLFDSLTFVGFDDVLPAESVEALRQEVTLREGDVLVAPEILRVQEAAQHALQDHGFPYATVSIARRDLPGRRVAVTLEAEPRSKGYFGRIEIAGNTQVDDEVIRRELVYRPGEPFSRARVLESQRRLEALPIFAAVSVEARPSDEHPLEVVTRIVVTEADVQQFTYSGGYGTEEAVSVEAAWRHVNFLGGARVLSVHGRWSWLDRGVEGRFGQPYFFRPDLSFAMRARVWHLDESRFRALSSGGNAAVIWSPRRSFSSTFSFTAEQSNNQIDPDALDDPELQDDLIAYGLDPVTGKQEGLLNAIAMDLQQTTVENLLDPQAGYSLALHLEQAGGWLPGTYNYLNAQADGRYYASPLKGVVLAGRLRYGSIAPMDQPSDVPFYRRYFLGGATSLRGWGRYEISPLSDTGLPVGGFSVFEASGEARVHVAGPLGGVVFLDLGNVWADEWNFDARNLLYAAGAGVRYASRFGLFRLDVGYQLNRLEGLRIDGEPQDRPWRVHFSVGQAF